MSRLDYLAEGLLDGGRLRPDSPIRAREVAPLLVEGGVDPAVVELLAERLARWATELGDNVVSAHVVRAGIADLELPDPLADLLAAALGRPADARGLAALAVHLVDLAEAMAIRVFLPELPALSAKADRTGGAARQVGLARHLKG